MIELFDWQRPKADAMARALRDRRFCLAACATGSGKTFMALDAARARGGRWLVIAPKATHTQWRRAAQSLGCEAVVAGVINAERISRGCEWYDPDRLWQLPADAAGVIADEIHRGASGPKSKYGLALAQLRAYPVSLLAMSATPGSSPLQMRVTAYWGGLCGYSRPEFYGWCRRHGCADVDVGWGRGSAGRSVFKFTAGKKRAAEIMAEIRAGFGDAFVGLGHDDIPGFPEQVVDAVVIDLGKRDRDEIDACYSAMSERLRGVAASDMAENGRERERVEYLLSEALAERVAEAVDAGYSAAVFLNFTEPRLRFEARLRELDIDCVSIHGGQVGDRGARERQAAVDAFGDDSVWVCVANASAGGVGVNLHAVPGRRPRQSFIIPNYNPAELVQCLGRIRRAGGTTAYQNLVVAAGTVMEGVVASALRKQDCLGALLGHGVGFGDIKV